MKKIIILFLVLTIVVTGCNSKNNNIKKENNDGETLTFAYKGVDVTPGLEFKSSSIDEEANYIELTSCAFEGNDKVYTYENIEITASQMNGKDTVYSVYFLNDKVATPEGVKIADDKSVMIEKYGEDYEQISNQYKYVKSNVILSFIVENDVIISIEYQYNK
ncbi:MAG: lipoprotein [Ignavibacteriales bacterium]